MRTSKSRLAALVAAFAVSLVAPANAADKLIDHAETDIIQTKNSPIAIVGNDVVWLDVVQFEHDRAAVSAVGPNGRKRTLVRVTKAQADAQTLLRFDASEGRLGISEFQEVLRPSPPDVHLFNRVATNTLTGPFQELDRCDATPGTLVDSGRQVRVAAGAVAYAGQGCERSGVTVRSLTVGYTRRLPDATPVFFDTAGDLLAYSSASGGGEVVYDHANDRTLYTTSGRQPNGAPTFHLSLQADGKLLGTDSSPINATKVCKVNVAIFTPAQPAGREYPFTSCGSDAVLSGDRVTMLRQAGTGAELVNTDLNGGDVKLLARFRTPALMMSLDAEGTKVAWHAYECGSKPIYTSDDKVQPPTAGSCPLTMPRSVKADKRRRAVAVPIDCPRGCQNVGLSLDLGGGVEPFAPRRVRIRRGKKTIKIPLSAAARKRLGTRGANARLTASYVPTTATERRLTRKVRVDVAR